MTLSEKMTRIMDAQGLSIKDVADRSGIVRNSISAYKRGLKRPKTVDYYQRIASALGCSALYLADDTEDNPYAANSPQDKRSHHVQAANERAEIITTKICQLLDNVSAEQAEEIMQRLNGAYWGRKNL